MLKKVRLNLKSYLSKALHGITDKLDPHNSVLPPRAFDQLTIDTQGKFGGIGVIVKTKDKKLIVIQPIDGFSC